MRPTKERDRRILELRGAGLSRGEVARKLDLSPSRIYLIERQDAADAELAKKNSKLREEIRIADDLNRRWPVGDLIDALGLIRVTRKRLLDHFEKVDQALICLRELMDLIFPEMADATGSFVMPPLLGVSGIGKKGFWSVVNGLTQMDLGSRCNEEWRKRLVKVKRNWGIAE